MKFQVAVPSLHPLSASSRAATVLGIAVAFGLMLLGLAALAAAGLGWPGLRLPGFLSLASGGVTAGVIRWRRARYELDREAIVDLATAKDCLERHDHALAIAAASRAAARARTSRTRNAALTTLAWAALGNGHAERAKAALDQIAPAHALDLYCLAAAESARGQLGGAIEALELARTTGRFTCDGAKLLVDCYLRERGIERAVRAALELRDALGVENCTKVVKAACDAGAHGAAAMLASAIRSDVDRLRSIADAHAG